MKEIIEYYYNLKIDNLIEKDDKYFFNVGNNTCIFKKIFDLNTINDIYALTNKINIDKIILNKYNLLTTMINNSYYCLLLAKKNNISLPRIAVFSSINIASIKVLERNSWEKLWEDRNDYIEEFIGQNSIKYPLIRESSDYFIGLAENAISYLVNNKRENVKDVFLDGMVLSHKSLNDSLYDPFNIIFDHKSRDVAEYIKLSFFKNNSNIYYELDNYFKNNPYSRYGMEVLYSRVLYPSFYFNVYDEIISGKKEEKEINYIINKIDAYEKYLYSIYLYLTKYFPIPIPNWLDRKN